MTAPLKNLAQILSNAIFAFGLASLPGIAFAQANVSITPDDGALLGTSTLTGLSSSSVRGAKSVNELVFGLGQQNYLNRQNPPAGSPRYTELSAHLKTSTNNRSVDGVLELGGSFATDVENYTMVEVPEAYLTWAHIGKNDQAPNVRLSLGRKRETWSVLDQNWELGLVEPLNRFDAIHPTEQGLTGGFAEYTQGPFSVIAFGSAVFIPEQGPTYKLDNGRFTSNNPWFSAPPDSLILFDQRTNVDYHLQIPAIGSIIQQNSGGFIVRYGQLEEMGFFAQASFVHKPRNGLTLPFDGKLTITDNSTFGNVNVYPTVISHEVVSADVGYRFETVSVGLSGLTEHVNNRDLSPDLTVENLAPLSLLSPSIEWRMFVSQPWSPRFRFSYLKTYGGETSSVGPLASNGSVMGARLLYREALSLNAKSRLLTRPTWKLDGGFRWVEEIAERGSMVLADVDLSLGEAWRMTLSADLLGSGQPLDKTDTFISRFRGDGRIGARVAYIF